MSRWARQHGAPARGVFAVVVLVSLAVLFAPPSGVPSAPAGVDKVVHGVLFAALAVSARWAGVRPVPAAVALVLDAAVSELVQGTDLVGRSASLGDWVADVVGVAVGLAAWRWVGRHRRPEGPGCAPGARW